MVPRLGPSDPMPSAETALAEPNGLVAVGGGLSVARLLDAYRRGIFPWFDDGDPVLWWSPDPRLVLPTDAVHVSRSLARRLRRRDVAVTADTAFAAVVAACAAPRDDDGRTWITADMRAAYEALHDHGAAHSLEVWDRRRPGRRHLRRGHRPRLLRRVDVLARHRRLEDRDRVPGPPAGALGGAVHRLPGDQRPPGDAWGRSRSGGATSCARWRTWSSSRGFPVPGSSTPTCPIGWRSGARWQAILASSPGDPGPETR